jgi:hypothetical protein
MSSHIQSLPPAARRIASPHPAQPSKRSFAVHRLALYTLFASAVLYLFIA